MKPPRFEYHRPSTITEALELVDRHPDSRFLAGGQSLVPLLNMRLVRPQAIVDLNRVSGLDDIRAIGSEIHIGAMVRQQRIETDATICLRLPILGAAASQIAHLAIRSRGTVGGSLAHADPAAELPAAMMVLEGRMLVAGVDGVSRIIPASEFFQGPFSTSIRPGEILTGIEVDPPPEGTGWSFREVTRVHGAFALVGVAALIGLSADRTVDLARLSLFGVGAVPYLASWVSETAKGRVLDDQLVTEISERIADHIEPLSDVQACADYRRRVAVTITARALVEAGQRALS